MWRHRWHLAPHLLRLKHSRTLIGVPATASGPWKGRDGCACAQEPASGCAVIPGDLFAYCKGGAPAVRSRRSCLESSCRATSVGPQKRPVALPVPASPLASSPDSISHAPLLPGDGSRGCPKWVGRRPVAAPGGQQVRSARDRAIGNARGLSGAAKLEPTPCPTWGLLGVVQPLGTVPIVRSRPRRLVRAACRPTAAAAIQPLGGHPLLTRRLPPTCRLPAPLGGQRAQDHVFLHALLAGGAARVCRLQRRGETAGWRAQRPPQRRSLLYTAGRHIDDTASNTFCHTVRQNPCRRAPPRCMPPVSCFRPCRQPWSAPCRCLPPSALHRLQLLQALWRWRARCWPGCWCGAAPHPPTY